MVLEVEDARYGMGAEGVSSVDEDVVEDKHRQFIA
jgi:hypothetical protein